MRISLPLFTSAGTFAFKDEDAIKRITPLTRFLPPLRQIKAPLSQSPCFYFCTSCVLFCREGGGCWSASRPCAPVPHRIHPRAPGCSLPGCSPGQALTYGRIPPVLLLLPPHAGLATFSQRQLANLSASTTRFSFLLPEPSDQLGLNTLKPVCFSLFRVQTQRSYTHTHTAENTKIKVFTFAVTFLESALSGEDFGIILYEVSYSLIWMFCTFSFWLGCFFRSNWKKTHGGLSSGLCWKDYAPHLAWEHLWIPQEELGGAARKTEVQMPL